MCLGRAEVDAVGDEGGVADVEVADGDARRAVGVEVDAVDVAVVGEGEDEAAVVGRQPGDIVAAAAVVSRVRAVGMSSPSTRPLRGGLSGCGHQ